jgi:hypothetical protein
VPEQKSDGAHLGSSFLNTLRVRADISLEDTPEVTRAATIVKTLTKPIASGIRPMEEPNVFEIVEPSLDGHRGRKYGGLSGSSQT